MKKKLRSNSPGTDLCNFWHPWDTRLWLISHASAHFKNENIVPFISDTYLVFHQDLDTLAKKAKKIGKVCLNSSYFQALQISPFNLTNIYQKFSKCYTFFKAMKIPLQFDEYFWQFQNTNTSRSYTHFLLVVWLFCS